MRSGAIVDLFELSTTDLGLAHARLDELYSPESRAVISGNTANFRCELSLATAGRVGADRIRHTMSASVRMPPVPLFVVSTVLHGGQRFAAGGEEIDLVPGLVARRSTEAELHATWSDVTVATLRMPLDDVERVAEEKYGVETAKLRFEGMAAVSRRHAAQWRRLAAFVHHEIKSPQSILDHPVVEQEIVQLIAVTALSVFPNTTMDQTYQRSPGHVGAVTLRRAVEFIEVHAAEPITLTSIARAAATSPRALQLAFRKHYDVTPMEYLRAVRLDRAHHELKSADPTTGVTIAAVAARVGFGHAARFSTYYRQRYGVAPRDTLHS